MKRTALTRNRTPRRSTASMSLFPFLVVLICTMGALILLLVIIARQARARAAQDSASRNAETRKQLTDAREWARVEIDEYCHSRRETESQLAEARLALGHVEDHTRQLQSELARLKATWNELDGLHDRGADRQGKLKAEVAGLEREIARAERELAQAREAAGRRRSYAVVPYEGPHGTHRRPIYIECRADAVVLQPEGIAFDSDDFNGPLGPGNPFDAALRAVREYLLRHHGFDPSETGEPYPLLLVRPDGVEAYYAARAAMKSWASEFGYELIGEDWQLEFPPPDPQLAGEVAQAVTAARAKQQRLIAAAPARHTGSSQAGFVASANRGGLVPRYGRGSGDDDASAYRSRRPSGRFGSRFRAGDDDGPARASTPGTSGSFDAREATGPSDASGTPGTAAASDMPGASQKPGPSATLGDPRVFATHSENGAQGRANRPQGASQGAEAGARPESRHGEVACPVASLGGRPESMAKVRGRNWGLPNGAEGWVPITAPVRVDCLADRLIVVPEKGLGQPKAIPLGARTEEAVDELVSAVWDYMERWGSAGNGMYWRPVLRLHVAPGAEARYADLEALLEGSGLGVERGAANDEG